MEDRNIEYASKILEYAHEMLKDNKKSQKFNCVKCNGGANITFIQGGSFEYECKSCGVVEGIVIL